MFLKMGCNTDPQYLLGKGQSHSLKSVEEHELTHGHRCLILHVFIAMISGVGSFEDKIGNYLCDGMREPDNNRL